MLGQSSLEPQAPTQKRENIPQLVLCMGVCVCFCSCKLQGQGCQLGEGKKRRGRGRGPGDCTCVVAIKEKGAEEGLALKKRDRWPGRGEGLGRRTTPHPL